MACWRLAPESLVIKYAPFDLPAYKLKGAAISGSNTNTIVSNNGNILTIWRPFESNSHRIGIRKSSTKIIGNESCEGWTGRMIDRNNRQPQLKTIAKFKVSKTIILRE